MRRNPRATPGEAYGRHQAEQHAKGGYVYWLLADEDDPHAWVPIEIEEFLSVNETLAPEDIEEIRALKPGHQFHGGGGASPEWSVWCGRDLDDVPGTPVDNLYPNLSRAHPLSGRASMSRHYGTDVDEEKLERIRGAEGEDLDKAVKRYKTFHEKDPHWIVELPHDLPKRVVPVGDALASMYVTDKWKKDGHDIEYKHRHGPNEEKWYAVGEGVIVYEPESEVGKSVIVDSRGHREPAPIVAAPQRLPVSAPRALVRLGYSLGFFIRRFGNQSIEESNPRGCDLYCSPSGDLLVVYSPDKQPDGSDGFLALMCGGKLRVIADGIDG